jgi:hypothetical protein
MKRKMKIFNKENLQITIQIIQNVWDIFGIYIVWIVLHFISSNLYVHYCTPNTLIGFVSSPIVSPLPHCQAFRWIIYNGGNSIMNMWIILGLWLMKHLVIITLKSVNN